MRTKFQIPPALRKLCNNQNAYKDYIAQIQKENSRIAPVSPPVFGKQTSPNATTSVNGSNGTNSNSTAAAGRRKREIIYVGDLRELENKKGQ